MSDSLTTRLDTPYAQQPETRAAALRYLERTGNLDVATILGLVDDPIAAERAREKALRDMGAINRGGAR